MANDMTVTEAGKRKIIPAGALELQFNEVVLALSEPAEQRPRIYAYAFQGPHEGQVLKVNSLQGYSEHKMNIQFYWTPQLKNITDLIKRAK